MTTQQERDFRKAIDVMEDVLVTLDSMIKSAAICGETTAIWNLREEKESIKNVISYLSEELISV